MAGAKGTSRKPRSSHRVRPRLNRIMLALLGAALVTGVCGCWLAALPLAINAAEGVGSAVANVAIGTVVAVHQGSGQSADQDHPGEDQMDREDRCGQLQFDVPGLIELHKGAAGAPEYRELQLGGSLAQPQWMPIVDKDTNAAGWRPALHFLQMNFTPPLGALPDAGSDYLAYRPMQSEASDPGVEFVPLTVNFGKTEGTFRWNGDLYQFALARTLPCFPAPR
jgi:hypothetical protein